MDEAQKVQEFMELTGSNDPNLCRAVLEENNWSLESAAESFLGGSRADRIPRSAHQHLRPRVTSATLNRSPPEDNPASASPTDVVRGIRQGRASRVGGNSLWALVIYLFRLASKILNFVLRVPEYFFTLPTFLRRLLGSVQRTHRLPPPAATVNFTQLFETMFGLDHPDFFHGSFVEAVEYANQNVKFLLIYIHSPEHPSSPGFCREVLGSQPVIGFINSNVVIWAADVRSRSGFVASNSFRASTFPFCVLVSGLASPRKVSILWQMEGPVSSVSFLTQIQTVVDQHETTLVAARLEIQEREINRRLKQEQDTAYAAALRADQEVERKRKEEEQRVQREREEEEREKREEEMKRVEEERRKEEEDAARIRRMEEKALALGVEPEKGPNVTQVLIRFPGGERKERRFAKSIHIQAVYDFVDSVGILPTMKYALLSNFPRVMYGQDKLNLTLEEAGLHPNANLFILELDN